MLPDSFKSSSSYACSYEDRKEALQNDQHDLLNEDPKGVSVLSGTNRAKKVRKGNSWEKSR